MRKFSIFTLSFILSLNSFARESTLLDSGWRFKPGESDGAQNVKFGEHSDKFWQTVSVPHCWGREEAEQGREYYQGPGWYRRALKITPEAGKRYFIRFEAAGSVADVYLNGQWLGRHRGAFGAFAFEITTNLSPGGTNVLAVRANNAPEPDLAPLSGDFPVYGGLYRPVHLVVTGPENFTLTDHGSPGVAWRQTAVTDTQAVLDVAAQIAVRQDRKQPLTFAASVFDAGGNCVASNETGITISAATNMTSPYGLRVVVPKPHLWNGRPDPYLYRAVVELRATNEVVDAVEQPLGLRSFQVDTNRGFLLNGKPYPVYGVCRHQDRPGKGWALTEADQDEDLALIKEIGATAVRCAHYQHSEYFYSLCDKAGLLVWAELPQVNIIRNTPEFENASRDQLLDLIRQNINHPSIFAWCLFNEIGPGSDDPHRNLQNLNIVANGEDATRPTIAATRTVGFPQMNKIPDWLGWNLYYGWYVGKKDGLGEQLDKYRDSSRHGGFCMSEYGAGANVNQHEDNPKQPKWSGPWHPEEWQNEVHEADWAAIRARSFVWGSFVWNMFDFTSYFRREGAVEGVNDKGLVTRDRKTKKDAFFFYQANWSDEPVLYLASRRFTERTNVLTDVKIYSNTDKVELLLNGKSQGRRSDGTNGVFLWKGVSLKPGENRVEARAERHGQKLNDSCVWTLK
jgi:beta-galactosidase